MENTKYIHLSYKLEEIKFYINNINKFIGTYDSAMASIAA